MAPHEQTCPSPPHAPVFNSSRLSGSLSVVTAQDTLAGWSLSQLAQYSHTVYGTCSARPSLGLVMPPMPLPGQPVSSAP